MRDQMAGAAGSSELTARKWIAANVSMRVCRAPIPDPKKEYALVPSAVSVLLFPSYNLSGFDFRVSCLK